MTKNGTRAAVILGADGYDALLETVEGLADADVVREVRRAIAEFDSGDVVSANEMRSRLRYAGRPRG